MHPFTVRRSVHLFTVRDTETPLEFCQVRVGHALCSSASPKTPALPDHITMCLCLTLVLACRSLRTSHLGATKWRVDYTLCSSASPSILAPSGQFTMQVLSPKGLRRGKEEGDGGREGGQEGETVSFHLTRDKLRVLLHELEAARDVMKSVE